MPKKKPGHIDRDATGHAVHDAFNGKCGFEVVEREDGYIVAGATAQYFEKYKNWLSHEKKAIKYAKGKILDIGCGAGKHSLYLQSKHFDVLGIDISPLLIEVCKNQGLKKAKILSVENLDQLTQRFDTIHFLTRKEALILRF